MATAPTSLNLTMPHETTQPTLTYEGAYPLAAHDEVLRAAIEAHGGWLFKHTWCVPTLGTRPVTGDEGQSGRSPSRREGKITACNELGSRRHLMHRQRTGRATVSSAWTG